MFRIAVVLPALATALVAQYKALPDVVPLLSSSRAQLDQVHKHVAELESRLNDTQAQETEMIAGMKSKFEANLTAFMDLNNRTTIENDNLKADIEGLNTEIMNLRARAASLKKHNGNLVSDLHSLQENITTVAEFTLQAISKSEEMLDKAPELIVLSDLAQKDAQASQERDHSNRLRAVAKSKEAAVSLLQTDMVTDMVTDKPKKHISLSQKNGKTDLQTNMSMSYSSILSQSTLQGMLVPEADRIASGIVEMVNSALAELAVEHNESASKMNVQFNVDHQLQAEHYAELLDEQAQLNNTKTASIELKHRLGAAVDHLEGVHKELVLRGQSLRAFSKRMAFKPLPDADAVKAPDAALPVPPNLMNDTQFSSFLQVSSSKTDNKDLPNVTEVLTKPAEIFTALNSHVAQLGERLAEVQRQGQDHISGLKQKYEANLTDQKDHTGNVTAENNGLHADIDKLNENIANLRSTADDLNRKNKNLVDDLKSLQRNITTAQEFVMNAVNTTEEMLSSAPELGVLDELAQKDEEMIKQRAHSQRLGAVSSAKGGVSLLQMTVNKEFEDPHGLLELMDNALQALTVEQNASEAILTASYQKEYSEGADKLASLMGEQTDMKNTKSDAIELQAKLQGAVDHLQATHQALIEHSSAVRAFAKRMGLKPMPLEESVASVSLLQTQSSTHASVASAALPTTSEVMEKPKEMFATMSAHVSNLEARLMEVQKTNQDDMIASKHNYDVNLTAAKGQNKNITDHNSQLKADIKTINKSIRQLRSKANGLESDNNARLLDLQMMRANLTTAQEFMQKTMNSSDQMLFAAPELHVLTELSKKEEQMGSEREHSSRLGEVSSATSLLQVVAKPEDSHGLLDMMTDALQELAVEQNNSATTLRAAFDKDYDGLMQKRAAALQDQQSLNETKNSALVLEARLSAAVEHLEHVHSHLQERSESVHSFARRVSGEKHHTSNAGISLIQIEENKEQGKDKDLPLVKEVMEKPQAIFSTMTAHVSKLEEKLAQVQQQGQQSVSELKAKFEANLTAQKKQSQEITATNADIKAKAKATQNHIREVRAKSLELEQKNNNLIADIKRMQANITTAQEFMNKAMDKSSEMLFNSSALEVLDDLQRKEMEMNSAKLHSQRITEVASADGVSLLQLGKGDRPAKDTDLVGKDPHSLLDLMQSALEELAVQQNASETTLINSFDKDFGLGAEQQHELLEEQTNLNATQASNLELQARLEATAKHLEENHANLVKRNAAIHSFMQQMGLKSQPKMEQHHAAN